jgi:ribose transport system substrate-binding protein
VKKTLVFDSFGDPTKQIKAMQDMLAQKPDVILLTPMSKAALSAPVDRAMQAGIPVVLCGSGVNSDDYVAEVGRNLYDLAYATALATAKRLNGSGNVVMFNGIAGTDTAETWRQAAKDAFGRYPKIKIVADQYANWSIADAKKAATAISSSQSKIDAVWTGGSEMSIGTILAFAEAKRPMPLFGTTNPLNGFLRLAKQYKLKFNASPYPPAMSYYGVQAALSVLAGKSLKKYADVSGVMLHGQTTYTESSLAKHYHPEFNDDYIDPTPLPKSVLVKAGFGR